MNSHPLRKDATQHSLEDPTDGRVARILAIGLESRTWRDGGLNRYFGELLAALLGVGLPSKGLVAGEQLASDEQGLLELVADPSASMITRILGFTAGIKLHDDADVIDAHFALTATSLLFGGLRGRPLVVHFHGPWADESASTGQGWLVCTMKRCLEKVIYRRADAIVVLSGAFRRLLVELYGIRPWDISVVPPGVDTERFVPGDQTDARGALGLPKNAFVAVAVRRLVPRMGIDVLLEGWADLVRSTAKPAVLCIVGVGPQRAALEEHCSELGLDGLVRFAGRVDDAQLLLYYQAADVSIVPSVALEGFGLVVLESLASGTPVVASALDGLAEALFGLAPDLLVAPGDSRELSERLGRVVNGVEPLPSADRCRRYAESFEWRGIATRHVQLYADLISRGTHRGRAQTRDLRVAILGHSAQLSGGELAIHRALSGARGLDPHVIVAQDGPFVALLERSGISVEVLPMAEATRDMRRDRVQPSKLPMKAALHSLSYTLRLSVRLARLRPDIVHTNTLKAALYGGLAARIAGVPCVWHIRDRISDDYLPPGAVRIVRAAARFLPNAIIANSEATLQSLRLPKAGAKGRVVFDCVIPSPIDISQPISTRTSVGSDPLRVGMIGRLAPWKGQDVFLTGFAKAFPDGQETAVLVGSALFGEDEYEVQLRQLVRELGIEDRVEFRGFRFNIGEELAQVDVLVHASIIPEPFGQVVLEGMAAGLPVVAAGAGGPAEILVEGDTGLLYPPGNTDALALLLRRLADHPELRSHLGDRGRAAAAAYTPDRVAKQIVNVYGRVIEERKRSETRVG